jgi:hypothetical protein
VVRRTRCRQSRGSAPGRLPPHDGDRTQRHGDGDENSKGKWMSPAPSQRQRLPSTFTQSAHCAFAHRRQPAQVARSRKIQCSPALAAAAACLHAQRPVNRHTLRFREVMQMFHRGKACRVTSRPAWPGCGSRPGRPVRTASHDPTGHGRQALGQSPLRTPGQARRHRHRTSLRMRLRRCLHTCPGAGLCPDRLFMRMQATAHNGTAQT